MGVKLGLL